MEGDSTFMFAKAAALLSQTALCERFERFVLCIWPLVKYQRHDEGDALERLSKVECA